jgi:hypothetical protein
MLQVSSISVLVFNLYNGTWTSGQNSIEFQMYKKLWVLFLVSEIHWKLLQSVQFCWRLGSRKCILEEIQYANYGKDHLLFVCQIVFCKLYAMCSVWICVTSQMFCLTDKKFMQWVVTGDFGTSWPGSALFNVARWMWCCSWVHKFPWMCRSEGQRHKCVLFSEWEPVVCSIELWIFKLTAG